MPAPKMLSGLPKPVLFGLYGAIGGLLGALVFAEPLYQMLEPPKAEAAKPEPQVAVAASPEVQLFAGKSNKFTVEIARAEFNEPVTVKFENLPAGVTIAPVTIAKSETKATATITAVPGAAALTQPIKVIAEAEANGKKLAAETSTKAIVMMPRTQAEADVFFVLDVTASMNWAITGLRDGISGFAGHMRKEKIDFRVGVVAYRDLFVGQGSQILRFRSAKDGNDVFTDDPREFSEEVGQLTAMGGGDDPESTLDAVIEACNQPFRKSATKVLMIITDNPPKNLFKQGGQTRDGQKASADEIRETADKVRAAGIDFVHVVTYPSLTVYKPLQDAASGKGQRVFDLERAARGTGFNDLVNDFSREVAVAAAAKGPLGNLQAGSEAKAPEIGKKALQSNKDYAKGTELRLAIASAMWTAAIAALVCLALSAGQHHYLRGTLPAAAGAGIGLLGGFVVGLVGGAAGQGLYMIAGDSVILARIFQLLGWALLGGLAGAGLSFFIPNLKPAHGLAGGAIGGAVGALGFMAVSAVGGDLIGRLVGGLLLGLCIGLMVAIVEAAFRRAWLEVRFGERETINVNLGPEPVKVGGDGRACTVWARGAPPLALRYFIRNGQVICEDSPTRSETVADDGDVREVGNVRVTVRTGTSAAPPGPPPMPKPPALPKPLAASQATPPAKPQAAVEEPMLLDDDDPLPLPMPAKAPPPPAAAPARPPVPAAGARPPIPPPPATRPAVAPAKPQAAAPGPRDLDACPGCGRKNPGRPGARYCMLCDNTY